MILGYLWVGVALTKGVDSRIMVCPIKVVTGFPCPACGSTRSVVNLIEGNLLGAVKSNPFGFLVFGILLFTPFWLAYDFISKKESLWQFYQSVESFVRKRKVAIILIILVIANWFWNISKGL